MAWRLPLQIMLAFDSASFYSMAFQMIPNHFIRIELGRIGKKKNNMGNGTNVVPPGQDSHSYTGLVESGKEMEQARKGEGEVNVVNEACPLYSIFYTALTANKFSSIVCDRHGMSFPGCKSTSQVFAESKVRRRARFLRRLRTFWRTCRTASSPVSILFLGEARCLSP